MIFEVNLMVTSEVRGSFRSLGEQYGNCGGAGLLLDRTFSGGDLFGALNLISRVVVMLNRMHLHGLAKFC